MIKKYEQNVHLPSPPHLYTEPNQHSILSSLPPATYRSVSFCSISLDQNSRYLFVLGKSTIHLDSYALGIYWGTILQQVLTLYLKDIKFPWVSTLV